MKWKYEEATQTIRSVPENYWIATMDSWDAAVNHAANFIANYRQFFIELCMGRNLRRKV